MTNVLKIIFTISIVALGVSNSAYAVTVFTDGNFTMLDPTGKLFGGTNDVSWTFDETVINSTVNGTAFNGNFASSTPFFGATWATHDVRVFEQGIYSFDSTCTSSQIESGIADCGGLPSKTISMEVGAGQLGAHILFDYNGTYDIDIVLVWNQNSPWADADGASNPVNNLWLYSTGAILDPSLNWQLVSTDANGDGINGVPMVDGPFSAGNGGPGGFYANFNFGQISAVPVPSAFWLFGSGLFTLIGLRSRCRNTGNTKV